MHLVLIRVEGRETPTAPEPRDVEVDTTANVLLEWPALALRGNYGLYASSRPPSLGTVGVCPPLMNLLSKFASEVSHGLHAAAWTAARTWTLPDAAKQHSWATSVGRLELAIGAVVYRAPLKVLGVFALIGPHDAAARDEFLCYPAWITALAARIHEQLPTMAFSLQDWAAFNRVPLWQLVRSHVEQHHHHAAWSIPQQHGNASTATPESHTWPLCAQNQGLTGLAAPFFTLRFQRCRAQRKKQPHKSSEHAAATMRTHADATKKPGVILPADENASLRVDDTTSTAKLLAEWCNVHDEPTGAPVPSAASRRHTDPQHHRPSQRAVAQHSSSGGKGPKPALVDDALDAAVAICTPFFPRPRSTQPVTSAPPLRPRDVRLTAPVSEYDGRPDIALVGNAACGGAADDVHGVDATSVAEDSTRLSNSLCGEQTSPQRQQQVDPPHVTAGAVDGNNSGDNGPTARGNVSLPFAPERSDRYAGFDQPRDSVSRSTALIVADDDEVVVGSLSRDSIPKSAVASQRSDNGVAEAEDTVLVVPSEFVDEDPRVLADEVSDHAASVGSTLKDLLPASPTKAAGGQRPNSAIRLVLVREETILHYRCEGPVIISGDSGSSSSDTRGKDTLAVEGAVHLRWAPSPQQSTLRDDDDGEFFQRVLLRANSTGEGCNSDTDEGGCVEVISWRTLSVTVCASWCCPGDMLKTDTKGSAVPAIYSSAVSVRNQSSMAPREADDASSSDDDTSNSGGVEEVLANEFDDLSSTFPGTWVWHVDGDPGASPPRRAEGHSCPASVTISLLVQDCRRPSPKSGCNSGATQQQTERNASAPPLNLHIASYTVRPTAELRQALRASASRSRLSETQRAAAAVRCWRPLQVCCRWTLERPKRQVNLSAVGHLFKCSVDWTGIARKVDASKADDGSEACELRFVCLTLRPWVPPAGSWITSNSGSSHSVAEPAATKTTGAALMQEAVPAVGVGAKGQTPGEGRHGDRGFPLACVAKPSFDIQRLKKAQVAVCGWRNLLSAAPPASAGNDTHRTVAARFAYRARGRGRRSAASVPSVEESSSNIMAAVVEQLRRSQRVYLSFGCRGCFSGTKVAVKAPEDVEVAMQHETRGEYVVDCGGLNEAAPQEEEKSRPTTASSTLAERDDDDEIRNNDEAAVPSTAPAADTVATVDEGTSPSVLASVEGLLLSQGASVDDDVDVDEEEPFA